ncbi:Uncharacterised protein [Leminorella richardii]|uniref:Uncharacterized protein n=1 Tax=Leminorella richardii TaxID=158841 RepID=A0A2X4XY06_9GAMM|nr:hypothetical protein [Leminorella richardii]SQI41464.1 Uncharacterised protein [Leminorella richardii]
MTKFIYTDSKNSAIHWQECEKMRAPFIKIGRIDKEYASIFYDVTNYSMDIEAVSNDIKRLYLSYVEFFMCSHPQIEELEHQHYFLNLIVKTEHAECFAEQLYDYLVAKMASHQ